MIRKIITEIKKQGVSVVDMDILTYIFEQGGTVPQSDIVTELGIARNTVSLHLARLMVTCKGVAGHGFVASGEDSMKRNAEIVWLTKKGIRFLNELERWTNK